MNLRDNHLQQLVNLAEHLDEVSAHDTPSQVDWQELSLALREDAIFLREFILPKVTVAPRYSGTPRIAEFTPPPRSDIELTEGEPQTGTPFLAQNGAANHGG